MCLTNYNYDGLHLDYPNVPGRPYRKDTIRWKLVHNGRNKDEYKSPYMGFFYKKKSWNSAILSGNKGQRGFHVYISRKDARLNRWYFGSKPIIKKVRVSGFLRSGFENGDDRCETWKRIKFLN